MTRSQAEIVYGAIIGALVGIMAIRSERGKMMVRAFGGVIAVIGVILVLRI